MSAIESVTVGLARLALDAASMRHQAIANNIANVNTPGYAPARVDFEQQLGALRTALQQGQAPTASMLTGIAPRLERDVPATANGTASLDMEVSALAQNTVQYQALLKALDKHMSILSAAVAEGKR